MLLKKSLTNPLPLKKKLLTRSINVSGQNSQINKLIMKNRVPFW